MVFYYARYQVGLLRADQNTGLSVRGRPSAAGHPEELVVEPS